MSYLVLARKYRPQNFEQLVGQDHITKGFRDAIAAGRIGHAFLFTGPRGIGKTSCARILAKCLNCEKGPTLTPCGECHPCKEITLGNSFDVIEIDAASNRGIDEIRTLRENVKFAPSFAKFKIYIIDEVHMLTTEAFNALLKTLEEPPAHVKFILATTESHKIPPTILSRCQRFDFKRISVETIIANLKGICSKEKVQAQDEALFAIAKASQGSMRDALSIMDQLSSFGAQSVEAKDVYGMLGLVETDLLFELTDALIDKNCVKALEVFDQLIDKGKDVRQLGRDLTEYFRHLMIVKIGGVTLNDLIDYPKLFKQRLNDQAGRAQLPSILHSIDVFIEAQEMARVLDNWRMPFEISFAKLCFTSSMAVAAPVATQASAPAVGKMMAAPVVQRAATVVDSKQQPIKPVEATLTTIAHSGSITLNHIVQHWNALTHEISQQKMSLGSYLLEGGVHDFKEGKLIIGFTKEHVFAKEMLESIENVNLMTKVFSSKLGEPISVGLKIVDKLPEKADAQEVQKALETFGGEIVKEWHNKA